ncbi:DGQHR domain-containing protein [Thermomonas sp.]|uniref:DGQHR domain-containing protein n=1 Tax=Thermomonas sp. TaxID=1971895 RepID=UPI0035B4A9A0
MQIFDGNDVAYLQWLSSHPDGFVLNRRRGKSDGYLVLHRAGCRLVSDAGDNPSGGFTERAYVKVCSVDVGELREHAVAAGRLDGTFTGHCSRCTSRRDVHVGRKFGAPSGQSLHGDRMKKIEVAASRAKQGNLELYVTAIAVRDLIAPGFYSVETLDPDDANDKGYQRLLNKARAKKLADYIVKGQEEGDAFLPTSVFLATDKSIAYDAPANTLAIDLAQVGPFSVVDGQHRLEGLRMAAERDPRVLDFEVPVNIAVNLPWIAQMCHFLIVNTTQKSVDKSVEQRIVARLTEALDVEDMPNLPKWIDNTVQRGEVGKAVKLADYLNTTAESPWLGKIRMANVDASDASVNQRSFVKAIAKYVLTAANPLESFKDAEKERKAFLNYWRAIANVIDDGEASVLYKYNGVELFCKFSTPFFNKLQVAGKFTVPAMESLLHSCFDNMEGEYAGVGHSDFWAKGGKASFLNAGAINEIFKEMSRALHLSSASGDIEL